MSTATAEISTRDVMHFDPRLYPRSVETWQIIQTHWSFVRGERPSN